MDFTVTITDQKLLDGVSAAAKAYNDANKSVPDCVPLSDAQYVQFVMEKAAESYARAYGIL